MKFSQKSNAKRHEKMKHKVEKTSGYMLLQPSILDNTEEYICHVCPVPIAFSSKKTLKVHSIKIHNSRNDQILRGRFVRFLSEEEIESQSERKIACSICNEQFSCKQKLDVHTRESHNTVMYKCRLCSKEFRKEKLLKLHVWRNHTISSHKCVHCGHISTNYLAHLKHKRSHLYLKSRSITTFSSLKKAQQYNRRREEIDKMKRVLSTVPESMKKSMWNELLDVCPHYMDKMKTYPLEENEVIKLITDNNLSDKQVLKICQYLRQKWGKEIISKNIRQKLVSRKKCLDEFYTEIRLDKSTNLNFRTKAGKILSRSVTYCHDLPGLIAYKKLVENINNDDETMNVIGVDDGKDILKIVWNRSLMYKTDIGERKLTGPNRTIILAGVSKVKETHHNMAVLMELTKLNEVDYVMSMDLKLTNIMIRICSHSARYPCPYGECFKDDNGNWHKGRDRTGFNIKENRAKWIRSSAGRKINRANLKDYMNCENDPLLDKVEDPIIKLIPPPALHTILLGPVNHVYRGLQKVYPKVAQTISNLHIQQAKYHGQNFEGNQCRALLRKIEYLQIPDCFKEFKDVFLAIKDIHTLSNQPILSCNYHKVIDNFRQAWYRLRSTYTISTTPKIHILLDHLEDYFDETDMTLLNVLDELVENMHQFLHKRL